MTPRCDLCGEFQSENATVLADYNACHDCLSMLVENEIERRGERAEAQAFSSYHGGTAPYPFTDSERQEEQARIQRELK